MILGNKVVSFILILFSDIPDDRLAFGENESIVNNDGDESVLGRVTADGFRVGFLEEFRLVLEIFFDNLELGRFFSQSDVGLSGIGTDLAGDDCDLVHGQVIW
jgi:hypothetical protein